MIKIKFPKKPLNSQRKKAIDLSKKLKYTEDYYDAIAESENLIDFRELFSCIGRWNGVYTFIDNIEIDFNHLSNILYCIDNKVPFTNVKWYGFNGFYREDDFMDFDKIIKNISNGGYFMDSELDTLKNIGLIEVIDYKKRYRVDKECFKQKLIEIASVIKKIVPEFDCSKSLDLISKLPNEFNVGESKEDLNEESGDENEEEPQGEEWVDWYNLDKWHLEVIKLLRKIEENTKNGHKPTN